jgi:heme exporter protein A
VSHTILSVRLQAVRKIFGRQPVLRGVSFTLLPGQLALIMGANGAGKSTLLALLSTLSRPSSGQILYGDHDHGFAERHLRDRIGLVAHSPMLYRQMNARENLRFFARLYGVAQERETVELWLDRLGLMSVAQRPVQQLSRGMTQRVALARALLHDPALLLLDEPFAGLDQEATDLLRRELQAALAAQKIVAVVTHEVASVEGLSGHLLVLHQGRLAVDLREPRLDAARIMEHYRAAC